MLGLADPWVAATYLLSIASALLCVIYGLVNWRQDDDVPAPVHPADENLEFEEAV